jgi:hypothetical protein
LWLATDHNTKTRQKTDQQKGKSRTLKERTSREQTKNQWAYTKLPTYKTLNKITLKTPKAVFGNAENDDH